MSFSEINYKHQVIVFDIITEKAENLKAIEIPVSVPLIRVPAVHSSLAEALVALQQLPEAGNDFHIAPYLEVRVLLDGPEPGVRHKVETVLAAKNVRLAKIDVRYKTQSTEDGENEMVSHAQLNDLQPLDVLQRIYQSKYNNPLPEELLKLFQQVTQKISETDA